MGKMSGWLELLIVKTFLCVPRTVCCNETLSRFIHLVANTADTEQGLYIGRIDVKVRIGVINFMQIE